MSKKNKQDNTEGQDVFAVMRAAHLSANPLAERHLKLLADSHESTSEPEQPPEQPVVKPLAAKKGDKATEETSNESDSKKPWE